MMFKNADPADPRIVSLKNRYNKQMARLQTVDNISTAMEGVVFEYPPGSRQRYKFTGGFAAANQILGLLGWKAKEDITKQATREITGVEAQPGNDASPKLSESLIRRIVRESIRRNVLRYLL